MFNIKDKIVVVTGGLGQLGRQFSTSLLENGARVVILDLNDDVSQLTGKLQQAYVEERLLLHYADVTDRNSLVVALDKIETQWQAPFGLINNAALDSPPNAAAKENGPFETYPVESFDEVMAVNVKGVVLACQVFGGRMAQLGQGSIINISSIYGQVSPDQSLYQYRREQGETFYKPVAYSASKSAVMNLTRYLATYWAEQNVRVNTLTFGGVFNQQDDTFLQNYQARVPLGRMANEDEYNGAVVFLMSAAASYMTGSNMVIDGGWTAL